MKNVDRVELGKPSRLPDPSPLTPLPRWIGTRKPADGVRGIRTVRDDVLHIRICSDVKEALFCLAARRGLFASELLLALIEDALSELA